MNPTTLLLQPVDAWFFRDGRPYNKQESNQVDVESVFPPPPSTLVGSIRAALAREHGWNGDRSWSADLAKALGDGFEDLGQLSFSGPWLVREGAVDHGKSEADKAEPVFPAPLHLLGRLQSEGDPRRNQPQWAPAALLVPGEEVHCDLGKVSLPVAHSEGGGFKDAVGLWITGDGLGQALAGKLPAQEHIVRANELWQHEFRVGLVRGETTRTTDDRALYSPSYVRLCRGVSLAIEVGGVPDDWKIPAMFPLGGEGRLANCTATPQLILPPPPADAIRQSKHVTVTLLTPLCLPTNGGLLAHPAAGETFPACPGSRLSQPAWIGQPGWAGGILSSASHCRSHPAFPRAPPGSAPLTPRGPTRSSSFTAPRSDCAPTMGLDKSSSGPGTREEIRNEIDSAGIACRNIHSSGLRALDGLCGPAGGP